MIVHLAATWPAPPAESPWAEMRLQAPSCVRSAPQLARPRPAAKCTRSRRPSSAGLGRILPLRGTALRFEEWFVPTLSDEFKSGTKVYVTANALRKSLARIESGRARFALRLQHGSGCEIANSDERCLAVSHINNVLYLVIGAGNAAGRAAVLACRASGYQGLSVGLTGWECMRGKQGDVETLVIMQATLQEISLVKVPACAGCWLDG